MASEHIIKSYDEELRKLSNTITEMGGLAESQLATAIDAVIKRDSELAASVVEGDAKVDQLQISNGSAITRPMSPSARSHSIRPRRCGRSTHCRAWPTWRSCWSKR